MRTVDIQDDAKLNGRGVATLAATRYAGASDSQSNVVDFPLRTLERGGIEPLERINQFQFYELAKQLHELDDLNASSELDGVLWILFPLSAAINRLLEGNPIELGVSRQKAEALRKAVQDIIDRHFAQTNEQGEKSWKFPEKGQAPIPEWEWGHAKQALSNFETVFAEEMREAATYRVPARGIFDTRKLVDDADCAFPSDIAGQVPEKAKYEWKAAGRCMAFGMFTASGFHVARAVEGALEAYFHCFSSKKDHKLRQWGEYLDALEKITTSPAPNPRTLAELKQLKDDWRNPLMHPRVILAETDARSVFNNGETLIMMMAQELKTAADTGVQPGLALVDSRAADTK